MNGVRCYYGKRNWESLFKGVKLGRVKLGTVWSGGRLVGNWSEI